MYCYLQKAGIANEHTWNLANLEKRQALFENTGSGRKNRPVQTQKNRNRDGLLPVSVSLFQALGAGNEIGMLISLFPEITAWQALIHDPELRQVRGLCLAAYRAFPIYPA